MKFAAQGERMIRGEEIPLVIKEEEMRHIAKMQQTVQGFHPIFQITTVVQPEPTL